MLRFVILALIFSALSLVDMHTTLRGIEAGTMWELNPFVERYLLDSPTVALFVKGVAPLIVSGFLYLRLGLEKKPVFFRGRRLFSIDSSNVLFVFVVVHFIIALNGTFWAYMIYWFI